MILIISLNFFSLSCHQHQYHQPSTQLAWQYCISTKFVACTEPLLLNWSQALRYCHYLSWDGHNDWRLPNRNELLSLVDWQQRTPSITHILSKDTKNNVYWSATTKTQSPEKAYYSSFFSGYSYANNKQVQGYARCVRNL